MQSDRNHNSVLSQLTALQKMSEKELREKWLALYGSEPPQFKSRFLKKRLAYRIQELFYGGISESVKEKLFEMAASDPMATLINENGKFQPYREIHRKIVADGKILPGTRFIREWNGRQYEAIAREEGFEYNGRMFRSLSAIASEITGVKWNGLVFWGLKSRAAPGNK
jgi:hypothetical protein